MKYLLLITAFMTIGAQTPTHKSTLQKPKITVQWCDPSMMWGGSDGWHQYHCVDDPSGPVGKKGHIEEDKEAENSVAKEEEHKAVLAHALTTRVLTPKEMTEVLEYGPNIFVQNMVPYYKDEVDKRYQLSLEIQRELRAMEKEERDSK